MNSKMLSFCKTCPVAAALGSLLLVGACTGSALAQVRPPVRPATPVTRPTPAATATSSAVRSPSPSAVTTPVRRAAASEVTANRNATARPTPAPTNGNSARSNRPQTVYGIFETKRSTGETRLHKVGISGTEPKMSVQRQVSPRAENQVRPLNKANSNDSVFRSRVLEKIPSQPAGQPTARQRALQTERQIVTTHAVARGQSPTGNTLPKAAPFSPLPRKK
jgi:hypothetical protein